MSIINNSVCNYIKNWQDWGFVTLKNYLTTNKVLGVNYCSVTWLVYLATLVGAWCWVAKFIYLYAFSISGYDENVTLLIYCICFSYPVVTSSQSLVRDMVNITVSGFVWWRFTLLLDVWVIIFLIPTKDGNSNSLWVSDYLALLSLPRRWTNDS